MHPEPVIDAGEVGNGLNEETPMEPDSDLIFDLKKEINNLIWMNGDSRLTLGEAEERAILILELITKEPAAS